MCQKQFQLWLHTFDGISCYKHYSKYLNSGCARWGKERNTASRTEQTKVLHTKFLLHFTNDILLERFQYILFVRNEEDWSISLEKKCACHIIVAVLVYCFAVACISETVFFCFSRECIKTELHQKKKILRSKQSLIQEAI